MRRVNYAANRERINAQKRAAYALRQKNRGKKVSITDIAIQKVPLVAPNGADHQTTRSLLMLKQMLLLITGCGVNHRKVLYCAIITPGKVTFL